MEVLLMLIKNIFEREAIKGGDKEKEDIFYQVIF